MPNPIQVATQGKGFIPMLARGQAIAGRYGLTPRKMDEALTGFENALHESASPATFPVTASALALNPALAKKYSGRGLELAIHGWQHIDYSLLDAAEQSRHLDLARGIFQNLGVEAAGFRCPYLRWNEDTLVVLRKSGLLYDSSQALSMDVVKGSETETYRHVLEFYRARSSREMLALPSWSDGLIRIPYCLPDDESLVDRLHITDPAEMAEIWQAMLEFSYQSGELFTLGLHPERIHLCQEALRIVLKKARSFSPTVWIARLDEIARWYLALGQFTFQYQQVDVDLYRLNITTPAGAVILARGLSVIAATLPWAMGYQTVTANEFTLRCSKTPWIGLSPNAPAALQQFLRHQGFLVEVSADPQNYACYLDRKTFNPQDERALLELLEREDFPLVRLSRWPNGARSAMCVTGDIDAFTIWDYGRRIFAR